jgi:hypothetical protein
MVDFAALSRRFRRQNPAFSMQNARIWEAIFEAN